MIESYKKNLVSLLMKKERINNKIHLYNFQVKLYKTQMIIKIFKNLFKKFKNNKIKILSKLYVQKNLNNLKIQKRQ